MASRSTDHSFASIKDSDPAPLEPDDIITGEDNENSLSCAAIDQHLSARRKNAANFKQLSKREDHYRRITVAQEEPSEHDLHTSSKIRNAISLRDKWVYRRDVPEWYNYDPPRHCDYSVFVPPPYHPFDETLPASSNQICQWQDGIVHVFSDRASVMRRKPDISSPPLSGFAEDLSRLMTIVNDPECRSLAYRRLVLLQERFNMHIILNEDEERLSQIRVPHRDFYNVRKVDVHVHHSSLANQKHFLRFIKRKVRENGDELVWKNKREPEAPPLTLNEVFKSLDLSPEELSVDTLNVHADNSTFHRFDRFNLKYNPFGQSRLREIFMKTDNYNNGRFLAELTKEVFAELYDTKYQNSEYRVSIYGRHSQEWDRLGDWFIDHKIYSDNVRWLVQIPRLYSAYKANKSVETFQDMLDNIFTPLFQATVDPPGHPKISLMLQQIVGFDSVDDESLPQIRTNLSRCGTPDKWDGPDNPPYSYYSFYIYSNLVVLNRLRESKGMNTFTYRPHAGEAGDLEHLATSFLLAHGINHGLNLKKSPVLQYLFYLTQIGVAMSPLSNNMLFVEYTANPLPIYFRRGLNVTLSTDDPLQFAFTREPLVEEYSVAAQVWKLSSTDLCELARNSVLQSGFEPCIKARWLGDNWYKHGEAGNDVSKTNVPSIRLLYRHETLVDELRFIYNNAVPTDVQVLPTFLFKRFETGDNLNMNSTTSENCGKAQQNIESVKSGDKSACQ